jgi:hypothetical protein
VAFHSTASAWRVVAGPKAQSTGMGTISGTVTTDAGERTLVAQ